MEAVVLHNGRSVGRLPLVHAGTPSLFRASVPVREPGVYEVQAWVSDPSTGNTGMDRVTFIVSP